MHDLFSSAQTRGLPPSARVTARANTMQGSGGRVGEPDEHPSLAQTGRKRPEHVRDDTEDTDAAGIERMQAFGKKPVCPCFIHVFLLCFCF